MVAGVFRKWRGQLLGGDIDALNARMLASRDALFEAVGEKVNLFA